MSAVGYSTLAAMELRYPSFTVNMLADDNKDDGEADANVFAYVNGAVGEEIRGKLAPRYADYFAEWATTPLDQIVSISNRILIYELYARGRKKGASAIRDGAKRAREELDAIAAGSMDIYGVPERAAIDVDIAAGIPCGESGPAGKPTMTLDIRDTNNRVTTQGTLNGY